MAMYLRIEARGMSLCNRVVHRAAFLQTATVQEFVHGCPVRFVPFGAPLFLMQETNEVAYLHLYMHMYLTKIQSLSASQEPPH